MAQQAELLKNQYEDIEYVQFKEDMLNDVMGTYAFFYEQREILQAKNKKSKDLTNLEKKISCSLETLAFLKIKALMDPNIKAVDSNAAQRLLATILPYVAMSESQKWNLVREMCRPLYGSLIDDTTLGNMSLRNPAGERNSPMACTIQISPIPLKEINPDSQETEQTEQNRRVEVVKDDK